MISEEGERRWSSAESEISVQKRDSEEAEAAAGRFESRVRITCNTAALTVAFDGHEDEATRGQLILTGKGKYKENVCTFTPTIS